MTAPPLRAWAELGFNRPIFINILGPDPETLTKLAAMTPKDFKKGNDPYGERDFNSFSVAGRLCFFKIDYYAKGDLRLASDDPADPSKTERVMTIMLADEY